jgi:RimJ/RimL family protein N-acetyltransferase
MVTSQVAHRAAHRFGWSLGWAGEICIGWGIAQYCIVDGISEVEIGWAVARSHWRRGIATRLGQHALSEVTSLGLRSIVAYAREDNVASRRDDQARDDLRKELRLPRRAARTVPKALVER